MTDRLKGVYVAFEKDIREDDARATIDAIKCMRNVLAVESLVSDHVDWVAQERAKRELGTKLWDVIFPSKEAK